MNKELSLWQFISKQLEAYEKVMLLIVTESSGSSPGRQGFKMAVATDGEMQGSIGGGMMEVKLVELALKELREEFSTPIIKKQIHKKDISHHRSGMICSGEQTVIYFALHYGHLTVIKKIIIVLSGYQSAIIQLSYANRVSFFDLSKEVNGGPAYEFDKMNETDFTYKEKIGYLRQLYIVGGGHCALALSELMSKFDFYIHVLDDRPGLNTMEQNNYAHEKHILDSYDQSGAIIPSGKDVYVVVMTLGYRTDIEVLLQLEGKTFGYFGLLGSAAKITSLKEDLLRSGFSEKTFNEIHAPIGLKINSHTPEEIAVSIAAEIIQIKNN